MTEILILTSTFLLTYFGLKIFRAWSLKKGMLDIPNDRSSHTTPTPRGGGLVLVTVMLIFYILISYLYPGSFSWGYLVGAITISTISWLDDIYSVSIVWRLMTHAFAAVLMILDRGYWNEIDIPGISGAFGLGIVGMFITFLWIVWLINAYNFMDGIDGIAGIQAAVAGLGWLSLGWLTDIQDVTVFGGVILFSSLGFLLHNWHPARLFMGDVGSAFLGFTFAALPLLARSNTAKAIPLLPLSAFVFVWLFLFDSIVTFLRRSLRKEKVWNAHREHLYQRLVSTGLSHGVVSALYGAITIAVSTCIVVVYAVPGRYENYVLPIILVVTLAFLFYCAKRKALT